MPATQIERPFRIKTTLGDDALLLSSFTGYERVSTPFRFVLQLLSDDPNVDMQSLLTKPAVLSIKLDEDTERHIHGLFNRIDADGVRRRRHGRLPGRDGALALVPHPLLQLPHLPEQDRCPTSSSRFSKTGATPITSSNSRAPISRGSTACSTARPTSTSSRGCSRTKASSISSSRPRTSTRWCWPTTVPPSSPARTKPRLNMLRLWAAASMRTPFSASRRNVKVNTGTASLTDYDFQKPNTSLYATLASAEPAEYYDYPGKYSTKSDGDRYAKLRLEEREVELVTVRGKSNCMGFECGYKFTLQDFYRDEANQDYTLIALRPSWEEHQLPCRQSGTVRVHQRVRSHSQYGPVPAPAPGPQAGDPEHADRRGGRQVRRRNLDRQVWAHHRAILLGSGRRGRRKELLLDPGCPRLGGEPVGLHLHPAHRPGGGGQFPRGRPGPSPDHRVGLQCRPDAALSLCPTSRPRAP